MLDLPTTTNLPTSKQPIVVPTLPTKIVHFEHKIICLTSNEQQGHLRKGHTSRLWQLKALGLGFRFLILTQIFFTLEKGIFFMGPSCYTLATHPNGWKKDNLEENTPYVLYIILESSSSWLYTRVPTYRKSHSIDYGKTRRQRYTSVPDSRVENTLSNPFCTC